MSHDELARLTFIIQLAPYFANACKHNQEQAFLNHIAPLWLDRFPACTVETESPLQLEELLGLRLDGAASSVRTTEEIQEEQMKYVESNLRLVIQKIPFFAMDGWETELTLEADRKKRLALYRSRAEEKYPFEGHQFDVVLEESDRLRTQERQNEAAQRQALEKKPSVEEPPSEWQWDNAMAPHGWESTDSSNWGLGGDWDWARSCAHTEELVIYQLGLGSHPGYWF
ncbi:hypothetical protein Hypma_005434 [Hypsizygus marmoreus]|uniref:Uncharacterized protein n=1 Tax=Hypsizygus marmoreus TaxID=39966 RepID=A0A369J6B9_HYPMA|nr:hypothetical protein Hypma_005434 [Hypsizygus marmoreus]